MPPGIHPKETETSGVVLVDHGQPEYLDGARMQFSVRTVDWGHTAYFGDKEDAELFVRALIASRADLSAQKADRPPVAKRARTV